jgi:hypothetical protein
MSDLLRWLDGGDLRSDGTSNEVTDFILSNPKLLDELVEGLDSTQDVIRGRTADTLEKIARIQPAPVLKHLPIISRAALDDPVPMVRFHLAMTLGHLSMYEDHVDEIKRVLMELLDDTSVFTVSWAIASLCIVARLYPQNRERITQSIANLSNHSSVAIRTRVRKAMKTLTNPEAPLPKGWVKSIRLQHL